MTERAIFLFDIDGTLLRAGSRVHRDSFAHAYREVYGIPLDLDGVKAAGRTDTWLLAEPLRRHGFSDGEIWRRMPQAFAAMEAYVDEHLGDMRDDVLPGVPEVLDILHRRGQLLGLLTGNLRGIALAKMRKAGLARFFDTGGFGEESEVRAHLVPVALAKAGEQAGEPIPDSRAVVVGDTPLDVEAARIGGVKVAAVATGPISLEDLRAAEPDLLLPSLAEAEKAAEALLRLALTGARRS
jgi:phosphoglycolate phosphatase-like HAD superfamily hydrolase